MADDFTPPAPPPEKTIAMSAIEQQRAHLRPPQRKGMPGLNPTGYNGRDKRKLLSDFLEAMDPKRPGTTRLKVLLDAMYLRAQLGNTSFGIRLLEYYAGIPRSTPNELDMAEHMRRVARDSADLALKILGTRIYSMAPDELAKFFRECGGNPQGFLEAVEAQQGEARSQEIVKVLAKAPPAPLAQPGREGIPGGFAE